MALLLLSCFPAKLWAFLARDLHVSITTSAMKLSEVTASSKAEVAHSEWSIISIN